MRIRRGEQATQLPEPMPLGVEIDPESAKLYEQFAEGRSLDQVYALWKDPAVTNPTIRQRAVAVLTAPHDYELPYPHPDQSIGRLLNIDEAVDGERTYSLRRRLSDRPDLAEELAAGFLYWLDQTGGRIEGALDSRNDYQTAIRLLLPIVNEETADKLFAHYSINDLEPYENMDMASGYQPLIYLLYDDEVPRKYKDLGLAAWFDVAEQEEQGSAKPREEHERAIRKMAEFVRVWTYGDPVDDEIHTSLIAFLENHIPDDTMYVPSFAVRQVAEHITEDDLRFTFAWRHIAASPKEGWRQFRIDDDSDMVLVEWLSQEAGKRGLTQFEPKADALLQDYKTRRQKRAAAQAAELALQARLRT